MMRKIISDYGSDFRLSKTRLTNFKIRYELKGKNRLRAFRYAKFKDLMYPSRNYTYYYYSGNRERYHASFTMRPTLVQIGCQRFSGANARALYKAVMRFKKQLKKRSAK